MTRNEYWRHQYIKDRYLSHLTIDQLSDRIKYLIENLAILSECGKIGMRNISEEPWSGIMECFAHAQTELEIRKARPNNNFLALSSIPNSMIESSGKLKRVAELAKAKNPELIKFGKKEYLEKSSFKVSLASSFNDPSLNLAQIDDEMKAVFNPHPSEIKIKDAYGNLIDGITYVEISLKSSQDYYIFCSSYVFDIRLFDNFEADSCLFIYDGCKFRDDLRKNVSNEVSIQSFGCQPVEYLDPIKSNRPGKQPTIEFHKHIKYLYQHEYRHVFIPKIGQDLKKDLFLNIPEASNYSELICL
ncbi:hypothetical protein [Marinomonas polaris]|uniref:hypothetical protein n=1 Tax=Marinomonas polaris TaxID=293552 RepID=UPI003F96082B